MEGLALTDGSKRHVIHFHSREAACVDTDTGKLVDLIVKYENEEFLFSRFPAKLEMRLSIESEKGRRDLRHFNSEDMV